MNEKSNGYFPLQGKLKKLENNLKKIRNNEWLGM